MVSSWEGCRMPRPDEVVQVGPDIRAGLRAAGLPVPDGDDLEVARYAARYAVA